MRRNATKVAAAVLSLAVTMTSVNIPTSAAAATKKVKLNKTKATLTVGKSTTLKLKQGSKVLKATFTSNKKKIATVGKKTGKVTAKKKGTATITATYNKKKYKCKITVKKKATPATQAPTTAPTTEPTAVPTDAPSTAPTDAPSTEPTQAPADTVGAITSFKATKADTFVVEFDKAQPDAVTAEVTRGASKVDLTSTWNAERTALTLVSTAKLTTGEYTVTVKNGEASVTATTTVENEKIAEIKILNETALTGTSAGSTVENNEAYIYYDVVNQYDESMRTSTSINWTISSAASTQVDASAGKITITAGDNKAFTYGTDIYITGVNARSGVSISKSVKIGMAQAVDTVKFADFVVSKDARTQKLSSLPKNFAKNTYYLLFNAYDQNGNALPASDIKKADLTFISNAPMLVDSSISLEDDNSGVNDVFTIDGEDYKGVMINPGQYVDRGGEVTVTVISNKTGKRSEQVFVIGGNAVLQSLALSAPEGIVADGDENVKIPYVAKDTDGNTVTSYETIVRSSNAVTLTASDNSTLEIREENDGTAGIYWTDNVNEEDTNSYHLNHRFNNSSAYNDMDRSISLSTIVIGGESSNLMLNVADARRPVAIKSVKLNADNNNAIVAGNTATVDITTNDNGQINYIDQYNADLNRDIADKFFSLSGFGINNDKYVINVKASNGSALGLEDEKQYGGTNGDEIKFVASPDIKDSEQTVTVRYSIATLNSNGTATDVSRVRNESYTVVPTKDVVNDLEIVTNSSLYQLTTANSLYPNGTTIGETEATSGSGILDVVDNTGTLEIGAANTGISVKGKTRSGLTLTLPSGVCNSTENSAVAVKNGNINSVSGSAISWYELYDVNSTRYTRINATKAIVLDVYGNKVSKNITISDAASVPASVEFCNGWWGPQTDITINPTNAQIAGPRIYENAGWVSSGKGAVGAFGIIVKDQYGSVLTNDEFSVTLRVSGVEEASTDNTHLTNSFTVSGNGSSEKFYEETGLNISGAEIGDKFKITATVDRYGVSNQATVTVGSDTQAKVSNKEDLDKTFRTGVLKMNR